MQEIPTFLAQDKANILLTIVLSSHNNLHFLKAIFPDVAKEINGLPEIELLLVDDASSDGTSEWLAVMAARYSWLTLRRADFKNLGKVRRAAMAWAKGQYLTFLDSDDRFIPGALEWLCQCLRMQQPDIVMTPLLETQTLNQTLPSFEKVAEERLSNQTAIAYFVEHKQVQGHLSGKCFKKSLLQKIPIIPLACYEDMATTPYLIAAAQSIIWNPSPIYAYYKRADSLSSRSENWKYCAEYIEALLAIEKAFSGNVTALQLAHFWIGLAKDLLSSDYGKTLLMQNPIISQRIQAISGWDYWLASDVSFRWKRRYVSVKRKLAKLPLS